MDHQPRMVDALSEMHTLKEVEFGSTGPHTSKFLHKMQSEPTTVMLCAPRFDPNVSPWWLVLGAHLSFPSVETLSMVDPLSHHFPGPDQLARAFPNVKAFSVSRKEPRQSFTSPIVTWPTLERVRGTVGSLQGWTIGSPVHLVELVGYLSCSKVGRLRAVRNTIFASFSLPCAAADPIVVGLQPVALIFKLDISKEPEHVEQSLINSSTRLRYLAITFDLVKGVLAKDWWVSRLRAFIIKLGRTAHYASARPHFATSSQRPTSSVSSCASRWPHKNRQSKVPPRRHQLLVRILTYSSSCVPSRKIHDTRRARIAMSHSTLSPMKTCRFPGDMTSSPRSVVTRCPCPQGCIGGASSRRATGSRGRLMQVREGGLQIICAQQSMIAVSRSMVRTFTSRWGTLLMMLRRTPHQQSLRKHA